MSADQVILTFGILITLGAWAWADSVARRVFGDDDDGQGTRS